MEGDRAARKARLGVLRRAVAAWHSWTRFPPLIVRVIAAAGLAHSTAEVHDVPGDQQAALRKAVRAEIKLLTSSVASGRLLRLSWPAFVAVKLES
jgi:hypothetical protein